MKEIGTGQWLPFDVYTSLTPEARAGLAQWRKAHEDNPPSTEDLKRLIERLKEW